MKSANATHRVLPFTPAVSEPIHSHTEAVAPYPSRCARALAVLFGAVSLHIWGIPAPHPQPMPLAAFASRMMRAPRVPMAPPLQLAGWPSPTISRGRVTVENRFIRVSPPPALGVSPHTLRSEQLAVPVGTSGHLALATLPKSSPVPGRLPAAPVALSSPEATVVSASAPEAPERRSPAADPVVAPASVTPRPEPAGPAESSRAAAVSLPPDNDRAQKERAQQEKDVVLAVLREYSRAYERMDVRATKAVYPSVDDRRLRRAFDDLQEQRFRFADCGVAISSSGAGANAWCKGDATFRPKVGSLQHYPNSEWNFSLAREGGGWQILKATMQ
jgi:hypothetical protein